MKEFNFRAKQTTAHPPSTYLYANVWPQSHDLPHGQIELWTQDDGKKRPKKGPSVVMTLDGFRAVVKAMMSYVTAGEQ
jgi:hypothetical protein